MSIEIMGVSKRFGAARALEDVTLTLETGRIYGLLGANGAGKSTLLNIMTNRLYADAGRVLVDGLPAADSDGVLSRMFLAGEQNLYPEDMRVRGAFGAAALFYPGFDRDGALGLAEKFKLDGRKKIKSLSTGYGSIFRLIMALASGAPYLLLDEPTLGLDAVHRDLFYRELLSRYIAAPCTVVLSTHLISEVEHLIEEVVILGAGRVLRQMSREKLTGEAFTVSGSAGAVEAFLRGRRALSVRSLGGLKTACVEGRPPETLPEGLEAGAVSLQDYFVSLTGGEGEQ